jgi:phasin family protein
MVSIPEQFQAQLKFISSFANTAFEGAEKVIALNLGATRAAVEKSSSTLRQLMQARDPGEAFALGAMQGQPNFDKVFAYGRDLFRITSLTHAQLIASCGLPLPETALPSMAARSAPPLTSGPAKALDTLAATAIATLDERPKAPAARKTVKPVLKPASKADSAAKAVEKRAAKSVAKPAAGASKASVMTPAAVPPLKQADAPFPTLETRPATKPAVQEQPKP